MRRTIKAPRNAAQEESFPLYTGIPFDFGVFANPGSIAAVVELEINIVSFIPKIRGIWMCIDGGRIINADMARASLQTATAQALGWTFGEYIDYNNGFIDLSQYENYSIPEPADIPAINVDFIQYDAVDPKGVGELPFTSIPSAFLQAVSQAIDFHFTSIPLKREEIFEAGKRKQTEQSL